MRFQRGRGFGSERRSSGRGFDRDRGFDRERDDNTPKPINVGEEYDVEITEEGSRGDGIARIKNFVVFVNGAKKGDKCKITIKEVRNRFAIGEKSGEGSEASKEAVEATSEESEETPEETSEEVPEEAPAEESEEEKD